MNRLLTHTLMPGLILAASPAFAASGPFFSLHNTNFIVLLAFIVFIGVLFYFKVPGMVVGMLDKRAEGIQSDLDEARSLREEAQSILASYERKQKDVATQAEAIVEHARKEAAEAAEQAKTDLKATIVRRLAAAGDQIKSAEIAAVNEVRNTAVTVSIAAAQDLIAKKMSAADGNKMIEDAIKDVEAKLH